MTFWDFWTNNSQKMLGTVTAFFSVLGGLLASGAFDMLLSQQAIGWLGVITALVTGVAGTMTVKRGFSNTTAERVAESMATVAVAKAETAVAMEHALLAPSPIPKPVSPEG